MILILSVIFNYLLLLSDLKYQKNKSAKGLVAPWERWDAGLIPGPGTVG